MLLFRACEQAAGEYFADDALFTWTRFRFAADQRLL
jgi:hypothetical protein